MTENSSNSNNDLELFGIYFRVVDANKQPLGEDKTLYMAHMLATKCYDHALTILHLIRGTIVPELPELKNKIFIDFSTVNIALRASLETMFTFAYLFILPNDKSEKDFKYNCWMLTDLLHRQKFPASMNEHKEKLLKEKEETDNLKNMIFSNPCYLELPDKMKKNILKQKFKKNFGKWEFTHWVDIGVQIGLSEPFMTYYYKFLCSFSHSGYLSLMQLREVIVTGDKSPPLGGSIDLINIVLAKMISLYCFLFPISNSILDNDPKSKAVVDHYIMVGKLLLANHPMPNGAIDPESGST